MEERSDEILNRIEKLKRLREMGINPYPNDFNPKDTTADIISKFGNMTKDELAAKDAPVRAAGRIITIRDFGKASFFHIQDRHSRIQVYIKKDSIGEKGYDLFKHCIDMGDIVGISGKVFRTKTDELTIEALDIKLLTKTLRSLPEKWHGLTDIETRYRQRYVDLIVNKDARDVFLKRVRIIQLIREFLNTRDFIEVETPMMQSIPGGATAKPFRTHHNALDMDLYLRIAPELYLKRLVVGGFERVYEINRNFRNEGISTQHNPEFTMLEFYLAYATFEDLMDLTEEMLVSIAKEICGQLKIEYQGCEIDLTPPWQRISVKDAILKYSDAGEDVFKSKDAAYLYANKLKIDVVEDISHGKIISEIFEHVAEPKFIQPTFVTHYPLDVSPLSRKNENDPHVVDRFELLVAGREIANAFSELNDPIDQKDRFIQQMREKALGDEEAHLMDEDFIRALEHGMPPTAGEGIGIDRLVMLLTNSASIRDVILFPQLKERL